MPSDRLFRFSTFLALAFACICVGYAEYEVLPEVTAIGGGVIAAMIVLYRMEGRTELLSVPAANRLGLGLGAAMLIWAVFRLSREFRHDEFQNMPWQFLLAAMFGPLLLASIPAKLARREKHAADYWTLHAMGLIAVCLAGAIAQDWVTLVLIGGYATVACWAIALLHLRQASGALSAAPVAAMEVERDDSSSAPVRLRGWRIGGYLAAAGAAAVPLYLVSPPSPADKLSFGQPRMEVGFAADQMTDLRRTGELKINDEEAFRVKATVGGEPKTDVAVDQKWAGRVLRSYSNGLWTEGAEDAPLPTFFPAPLSRVSPWHPPDLGRGQCTFEFAVPRELRATSLLAAPVVWAGRQPIPVVNLTPGGELGEPWQNPGNGLFHNLANLGRSTLPLWYRQEWRPEPDPELSPLFQLTDPRLEEKLRKLRDFTFSPPRVKEYADRIVADLIHAGRLPPDCHDRLHLLPRPEFHDLIARAFTEHLSTTPELTYTTVLKRTRLDVDPVEDFLFYTKSGHCERFASALALMLRSQGIPAVLVLGFKGCEPTTEPGSYVVRHSRAHMWVMALIQEFKPRSISNSLPISCWRTLDPYPAAAATQAEAGREPPPVVSWARRMYLRFFSDASAEGRRRALEVLADWATRGETLAAAALAAVIMVGVRTWLRCQRSGSGIVASPHSSWYDRLLAELRPFGFSPQPGETPREFAARVSSELGSRPAARAIADIPTEWVEAYYELRYGDTPIEPSRQAALEERLEALKRALKSVG